VETGTLELRAYHESGSIIIEVVDDGGGINTRKVLAKARAAGLVGEDEVPSTEHINNLIFQPGFSTADKISDLSGRGVGLDVVRRNISDLGGHVHIESVEGEGSVFRIRLPLTLAILDGQLARVGGETYIIPLISILETLQVQREHINFIAGHVEVYRVRDEYLPIVRLSEHFHVPANGLNGSDGLLVIAEADGRRAGILVDDLLGQQQVVIKSLQTNYRTVPGFSGATILGDGTVSLILDVPGVIRSARQPVMAARPITKSSQFAAATATSTQLH
jgi:two-component system chemotaxis sensor kinase CheA